MKAYADPPWSSGPPERLLSHCSAIKPPGALRFLLQFQLSHLNINQQEKGKEWRRHTSCLQGHFIKLQIHSKLQVNDGSFLLVPPPYRLFHTVLCFEGFLPEQMPSVGSLALWLLLSAASGRYTQETRRWRGVSSGYLFPQLAPSQVARGWLYLSI